MTYEELKKYLYAAGDMNVANPGLATYIDPASIEQLELTGMEKSKKIGLSEGIGMAGAAVGMLNNAIGQSKIKSNAEDLAAVDSATNALGSRNQMDSFDALNSAYANLTPLQHVNYKDYLNGGAGDAVMNVLSQGVSGAQAGAAAGPIGAGIGAAVRMLSSGFGRIAARRKAKKQAKVTNAKIDYANAYAENAFTNQLGNLQDNQASMALSNFAAFGGNLNTNGADFPTGLRYFDAGSTHELNPYDGVQIGVDPQGVPNLVEEGETMFNDYVFSNRVKINDNIRKAYKLGKGVKTFADASKYLAKESEDMPNDPIAKRTLQSTLERLQQEQEAVKQQEREKEQLLQLQELEKAGITPEMLQQAMVQQQNPNEQMMQQIPAGLGYACGGNIKATGGINNSWGSNYNGYQQLEEAWIEHIINAENAARKGYNADSSTWSKIPTTREKKDENGNTVIDKKGRVVYEQGDDFEIMGLEFKNNPEVAKLYNKQGFLTQDQVNVFLINRMRKDYEGAKNLYDNRYGKGSFNALPYQAQLVLTDIHYNTGGKEFKKLQKHLSKSDWKNAMKETRSGNDRRRDIRNAWLQQLVDGVNPTVKLEVEPEPSTVVNPTVKLEVEPEPSTVVNPTVKDLSRFIDYSNYIDLAPRDATRVVNNIPMRTIPISSDIVGIGDGMVPVRNMYNQRGNVFDGFGNSFMSHYTPNYPIYGYYSNIYDKYPKVQTPNATFDSTLKLPETGQQKAFKDKWLSLSDVTLSDVTKKPVQESGEENGINYAQEWLRYAPVAGSAIGLGMALKSPDYSRADAIEKWADTNNYREVSFNPLGDYLAPRIYDVNQDINNINATAGATRRALLNNASLNRGVGMAGILASDYNTINAIGKARQAAYKQNADEEFRRAEFNRGTNSANSEGMLKADMANQNSYDAALNRAYTATVTANRMRDSIDAARNASISSNLTGIFDNLGSIGRENVARNFQDMLLRSDYYGTLYTKPRHWSNKDWNIYQENLAKKEQQKEQDRLNIQKIIEEAVNKSRNKSGK